jgi:hypothetical protein
MNTTNGNFIEKSIPDNSDATITVNIGGVDSTMTVEKFASAIVIPAPTPEPVIPYTPPYKSYLVTIGAGSFYLNKTEIYNSFTGINFTCSRVNTGYYLITASSAIFITNKTCVFVQNSLGAVNWVGVRVSDTVCSVGNYIANWTGGTRDGNVEGSQDTGSNPVLIEIRVYN